MDKGDAKAVGGGFEDLVIADDERDLHGQLAGFVAREQIIQTVAFFGDEQRDLAAILTPVQRGQLYRMRARLADRITTLREERMQRRPGMLRRP